MIQEEDKSDEKCNGRPEWLKLKEIYKCKDPVPKMQSKKENKFKNNKNLRIRRKKKVNSKR